MFHCIIRQKCTWSPSVKTSPQLVSCDVTALYRYISLCSMYMQLDVTSQWSTDKLTSSRKWCLSCPCFILTHADLHALWTIWDFVLYKHYWDVWRMRKEWLYICLPCCYFEWRKFSFLQNYNRLSLSFRMHSGNIECSHPWINEIAVGDIIHRLHTKSQAKKRC